MTDSPAAAPLAPPAPGAASMPAGAIAVGRQLREAREAMGADIGSLASALKVPVPKLEALEAGQLERLPDLAFARALVASICRLLNLDAAPLLAQLPRAGGQGLNNDSPALSGRLRHDAPVRTVAPARRVSRPLVAGVVALLLAAAALALVPSERLQQWGRAFGGGSKPPAESAPVMAQEPVAPVTDGAAAPTAMAPAASATPGMTTEAVTVAPAAGALAAPTPPAPAVTTLPANAAVPAASATMPAAASAAPAAATDVPLLLRARSDTWVKVTDTRGAVVLQKLLAKGSEERVDAPLPLNVVIGRADAAEVLVRGQPFDAAGTSRSNVARFQVK